MQNYKIKISNRIITRNTKPFLIAEVAQAHLGNIKNVFRYIDKISAYKIDAIKFQTHIAEFESTYDEPFRKKIKKFKSRFDYWRSVEFTDKEWKKIKLYCKKKRIIFLSSVFSIESIKLLSKIGLKTWKIGSGECNSIDILNYLKSKKSKDTIIVSTGLMNNNKIQNLYNFFRKKNPLCIMHCVSEYPSKFSMLGFNNIDDLNKKYKCIIGYSDHSGSVFPILYAISKGVPVIEFHVKINDDKRNIDSSSSINVKDLALIADANNAFNIFKKKKINKNSFNISQKRMLKIFSKSLSLKNDKKINEIISLNDLTLKKPGGGINYENIKNIIGKKLSKNVSSKRLIRYSDLKK